MFSRKASAIVTILLVALVTIGLVASALPTFASTASALPMHAQLLKTSPEDGASIATADEVTLTFSEDVNERFLQVKVEGPGGDETDGSPTVDGSTVTQPLPADLPAGEHEVTYRVVSVDGHPVSGSLTFTTTQAPATATPTPRDTPSPSATPSDTTSATPSPSPSATGVAADETSSGGAGWLLPVGLVVLLLLLVGGGLLLARGGRGRADGPAGPTA
ncbi:copper resistance CopC family protein [Arthrobacter sp. NEB 688]|uniref:copper resistance CopC family protein n=1 Tax=Arthrobacter sp. NEB 688 TaxID=904039 RepID=UPI001566958E|nr:copper resistance CopC family protein [Arthrobacter sp. NEB 688]QKE85419.1 copper resistance protein CopC [Arthrobacter sp. NEB 688]